MTVRPNFDRFALASLTRHEWEDKKTVKKQLRRMGIEYEKSGDYPVFTFTVSGHADRIDFFSDETEDLENEPGQLVYHGTGQGFRDSIGLKEILRRARGSAGSRAVTSRLVKSLSDDRCGARQIESSMRNLFLQAPAVDLAAHATFIDRCSSVRIPGCDRAHWCVRHTFRTHYRGFAIVPKNAWWLEITPGDIYLMDDHIDLTLASYFRVLGWETMDFESWGELMPLTCLKRECGRFGWHDWSADGFEAFFRDDRHFI